MILTYMYEQFETTESGRCIIFFSTTEIFKIAKPLCVSLQRG